MRAEVRITFVFNCIFTLGYQPKFVSIIHRLISRVVIEYRSKTNVILTSARLVGAIVDYAEHEKFDLVGIGTRGDLDIRRFYLEA